MAQAITSVLAHVSNLKMLLPSTHGHIWPTGANLPPAICDCTVVQKVEVGILSQTELMAMLILLAMIPALVTKALPPLPRLHRLQPAGTYLHWHLTVQRSKVTSTTV